MRTVEQTEVQPGALMAHAPASLTAAQLNATLAPYGLWLPICPLVANRTLADLVTDNSGGRYRLAHGPIGRYLRAASLESGVTLGGPTIKRATGYGLHRAIAGDGPSFGAPHAFTFSLHPLPAARSYTLLHCANPLATCQLAESLLQRGVALRALA
ncbi:MAG: FAD-binding oxidoreductase, partial [Oscillochloris sp.]|nr:FAD-binding oxidoreductase [Oscillochloris sp.]